MFPRPIAFHGRTTYLARQMSLGGRAIYYFQGREQAKNQTQTKPTETERTTPAMVLQEETRPLQGEKGNLLRREQAKNQTQTRTGGVIALMNVF